MKNKTLFIVALLASLFVEAQVPGYMGKKLSVGVNASTFVHSNDYDDGFTDMLASPGFSYKSELALTYTVGRRVSLGGSFYYGSQKFITPGGGGLLMEHFGGGYTTKEDYIRCRLMMYEFNLKIFRRNFLAPIGPYHQLGVALVRYKAISPGDTLQLYNEGASSSVVAVVNTNNTYSGAKLSYHIGYAAPVFKNGYFNFAFGFNYFKGGDTDKVKRSPDTNNFVKGTLNRDLRRYNNFEIKIGFSWLAL